jgi:hypothetical protein
MSVITKEEKLVRVSTIDLYFTEAISTVEEYARNNTDLDKESAEMIEGMFRYLRKCILDHSGTLETSTAIRLVK